MSEAVKKNIEVWENLYKNGNSIMNYPNDPFVRTSHRVLSPKKYKKILEVGFGSGADMLHNLKRGFECSGVEVSQSAIDITMEKVKNAGFSVDLRLISGDGKLPFDNEQFDAVIAWQVLCYNDWDTFTRMREEIDRVLKPAGLFMGTMTAMGDISQLNSRSLGNSLFESQVSGQEGATLLIVDKETLPTCFPGKNISIGQYTYEFEEIQSKHWIVIYNK